MLASQHKETENVLALRRVHTAGEATQITAKMAEDALGLRLTARERKLRFPASSQLHLTTISLQWHVSCVLASDLNQR